MTSLELEPRKAARWRENVHEAGLGDVADVIVGDASASLRSLTGRFDLVLIDAWKDDYETHFGLVRPLLEPGASWSRTTSGTTVGGSLPTSRPDRSDPTLSSLTLSVGNGLEVTSILS